eukprot:Mycagemm_TRINITY_DN9765_c0_g1::TRINITY_DN9765_c0_g1_i1::g.4828::m.4828 type:complete len:304 gc:universal TRINITY_DN9765_c0_g1_i1:327-1238(+)
MQVPPLSERLRIVGAHAGQTVERVACVRYERLLGLVPQTLPALHLRAADAEFVHDLSHTIGYYTEVLADWQHVNGAGERSKQLPPLLVPQALISGLPHSLRGLRSVRNCPDAEESHDVINTVEVVDLGGHSEASAPPGEIVLLHLWPVVEREAPVLTIGGKRVGRCAHRLCQAELVAALPDVSTVGCDEEGDVTHEEDAHGVGMLLHKEHLAIGEVLNVVVHTNAGSVDSKEILKLEELSAALDTELAGLIAEARKVVCRECARGSAALDERRRRRRGGRCGRRTTGRRHRRGTGSLGGDHWA